MNEPVLLIGQGKLSHSIAVCLLRAGHDVCFVHPDPAIAEDAVFQLLRESHDALSPVTQSGNLLVTVLPGQTERYSLAILITKDEIGEKKDAIRLARKNLAPNGMIAINLMSLELCEIQRTSDSPERIIGLNWVEPAHTTFFLEIIGDASSDPEALGALKNMAVNWGKDAYIVTSGFSVKARLSAALTREALFLVSNGYATHEDIDRNCRNDAGYYLPFVGNARYMDLMGTYAYGVVMEDLNKHLSKDRALDQDTRQLLAGRNLGMGTGKGFFDYSGDEIKEWEEKVSSFSYQIHHLIKKYSLEED